jgi:uncharacterized membrane protein YjjP (DUF1212 family)
MTEITTEEEQEILQEEAEKQAPKVDITKPIMTNRRYNRIKVEMEKINAEAQKQLRPPKTHQRYKMLNLICTGCAGLGIAIMMQGKASDLFVLGLQIFIGSLTIVTLVSIFLKTDR